MSSTLTPRWSAALPRQFESVSREMDQVLDHFFGNGREGIAAASAPTSLWEEEGRYGLEVDLPGVVQEDIDVTLDKNMLRLTAQRHAPQPERKYFHQDRAYGRIQRLITLPESVDPDAIEAELKDGVLRIYLAKRPELQPKKIQVKSS